MTASLLPTSRLYRTDLKNGLKLIVLENPVADIVSARLFIGIGQALETAETHGLVSFLMGLLTKGTTTLSAMAIAEMVESVGASLSTDATPDYSVVSLKTVSADLITSLPWPRSCCATRAFRSPKSIWSEIGRAHV